MRRFARLRALSITVPAPVNVDPSDPPFVYVQALDLSALPQLETFEVSCPDSRLATGHGLWRRLPPSIRRIRLTAAAVDPQNLGLNDLPVVTPDEDSSGDAPSGAADFPELHLAARKMRCMVREADAGRVCQGWRLVAQVAEVALECMFHAAETGHAFHETMEGKPAAAEYLAQVFPTPEYFWQLSVTMLQTYYVYSCCRCWQRAPSCETLRSCVAHR